ncbi:hypothetical protein ACETK8_02555 [Brevundimonas staleyi]
MIALENLPERDKDALRPIFPLRHWLSTKTLDRAFDRIEKAYGLRGAFVLPPAPPKPDDLSPTAQEIRALLDSADGYSRWCELFRTGRAQHSIPVLQLADASQFDLQAIAMLGLGRGAMVPFTRSAFSVLPAIATRVAALSGLGTDITFLIDLGKEGRTLLLQQAELTSIVDRLLQLCPNATVAISTSSFPASFTSLPRQEIYERQLYQHMRGQFGDALHYSDRGSARAESRGGGSTDPYPRIDYPLSGEWLFYRTETSIAYKGGYTKIASKLMNTPSVWDPRLRIWGTQMIEKTHLGQTGGISSPARSTAVRINLHLHRQLWFDSPSALYETDDDWQDI